MVLPVAFFGKAGGIGSNPIPSGFFGFDANSYARVSRLTNLSHDPASLDWEVWPSTGRTIQQTIANANENDVIFVHAGTYFENLIIDKTIILIGEDKNTTIISGENNSQDTILIIAHEVELTGFTINQGGSQQGCAGVLLYGSQYCLLFNNIIIDNGYLGINLIQAKENQLIQNTIQENMIGIALLENAVQNSSQNRNMSVNNSIFLNDISYNSLYGILISSPESNQDDQIIVENNTCAWNTVAGIFLEGTQSNQIKYNFIHSNTYAGINASNSYNNTIARNIIYSNFYGVRLQTSTYNKIYNNDFYENIVQGYDSNLDGQNVWYTEIPTLGNYWSDYLTRYPQATQETDDDYWNVPYEIFGGDNKDYYPKVGSMFPVSTVYVDDSYTSETPGWGYDHFKTIQDGIQRISPGGVVYVFNGEYEQGTKGPILLRKPISLIGESNEQTKIVDGQHYNIKITAQSVNISNFFLSKSSPFYDDWDPFISIEQSSQCNLSNIYIEGQENYDTGSECKGIELLSSSNISLYNIKIARTTIGVDIDGFYSDSSSNNSLVFCTIGPTVTSVFFHQFSMNNRVFHNNIQIPKVIQPGEELPVQDEGYNTRWDNGYPSGGNNWFYDSKSAFGSGMDSFHGPNQTILGRDGITDTAEGDGGLNPYVIRNNLDGENYDYYPFTLSFGWTKKPLQPSNPTPSNNSQGIDPSVVRLSWSSEPFTHFQVDFGTQYPPQVFIPRSDLNSVSLQNLEQNMTYYWRITAFDNRNMSTIGPIWRFTTISDLSGLPGYGKPTITIENPLPDSIIYNRTPRIKASYSDPDGIDVNSVRLIFNETDVTENATITESYVHYQPPVNLSFRLYNVSVTVSDTLGNSSTVDWSFTVNQSAFMVVENLGNLSEGNDTEIILDPNDTCIVRINVTTLTDLANVKITVAKIPDKPENIDEGPQASNVYEYLNIEMTKDDSPLQENDLELVTFRFKISQAWLSEHQIDKSSITFTRYHNDTWENLTTGYLKEDADYVYFVAFSPGFSTFAVVGNSLVEIQTYSTDMPKIPWITIILIIVIASILLVVVLFKAGYIYTEKEDEEKKP